MVGAAASLLLLLPPLLGAAAVAPPRGGAPACVPDAPGAAVAGPRRAPPELGAALLAALEDARLDRLRDAGPTEGLCPGGIGCPFPLPRVAVPLQVDLAVIELDRAGRAVAAANVQLDGASPRGRIVRLDRDLAAAGARFRRWSSSRRDGGPAQPPFGDDDLVAPARAADGPDFVAPYPASLFKLLVAFHVERRAAEGAFALAEPVEEGGAGGEVAPLELWLDRMMTVSDNRAAMVILRFLHRRGEVERLNRDLGELGLDTLRIDGTSPEDGGTWIPGQIEATAMDLARLLWLVAGGRGVLWRTPAGRAVLAETLPGPARARLLALLAGQAAHEILSSGTLCGARPPGIPALVPERFLDPATGAEEIGEIAYGRDVRPCNVAARVRFLHKTGLTWNFAADAGIVESLPGQPFRRYVVALLSSAGTRFVDPEDATAPRHPCEAEQRCVTARFAAVGAAIDAWAIEAAAREASLRAGIGGAAAGAASGRRPVWCKVPSP